MTYTAELFGSGWAQGPRATFATIHECREWAEEYGTTADECVIYKNGKVVARHKRDTNGNGMEWFEATL